MYIYIYTQIGITLKMSTSLARRPCCNKNHLGQFTLKLLVSQWSV